MDMADFPGNNYDVLGAYAQAASLSAAMNTRGTEAWATVSSQVATPVLNQPVAPPLRVQPAGTATQTDRNSDDSGFNQGASAWQGASWQDASVWTGRGLLDFSMAFYASLSGQQSQSFDPSQAQSQTGNTSSFGAFQQTGVSAYARMTQMSSLGFGGFSGAQPQGAGSSVNMLV